MTFLKPQAGVLPIAESTPLAREFREGCARGELLFQRCPKCGNAQFPPTAACRSCLEPGLQWEQSTGHGSVYSWTVVWRPQSPSFEVPYATAVIDVAEGYRLISNIVNCDAEAIHLDMPVEVVFTQLADGVTVPYFQPRQTM